MSTRRLAWSILALYAAAVYCAAALGYWTQVPSISIWDVQDSKQLLQWLFAVTTAVGIAIATFIPVGLLTVYMVGKGRINVPSSGRASDFSDGRRRLAVGMTTLN